MYAIRRLREEWDDLSPEGAQYYGELARGKARGFSLGAKKMAEIQSRKVASE